MSLLIPHDGKPLYLPESAALTALPDRHSVYYYQGKWEESVIHNTIVKTDFSDIGLRKIITISNNAFRILI